MKTREQRIAAALDASAFFARRRYMAEALREYEHDTSIVGFSLEATAGAWCDEGFTPDEARRWWAVGGWCPETCRALAEAGIAPSMIDSREAEQVLYDACNADISIDEAVEALR